MYSKSYRVEWDVKANEIEGLNHDLKSNDLIVKDGFGTILLFPCKYQFSDIENSRKEDLLFEWDKSLSEARAIEIQADLVKLEAGKYISYTSSTALAEHLGLIRDHIVDYDYLEERRKEHKQDVLRNMAY